MARIYELPTHLQVEDVLIAGLTARQLVRLMIGASLSYGVWDQAAWLQQEFRLALALVLTVTGVLLAVLQPGGRPLDQWLLAAALFVALPRRLTWRPGSALPRQATHRPRGWAGLVLHRGWVSRNEDAIESQPVPERHVLWWRRRW
jgi:hypothetical protein